LIPEIGVENALLHPQQLRI